MFYVQNKNRATIPPLQSDSIYLGRLPAPQTIYSKSTAGKTAKELDIMEITNKLLDGQRYCEVDIFEKKECPKICDVCGHCVGDFDPILFEPPYKYDND